MNIDTIREACRSQPFIPFTLRMNDGREFQVPHVEYIALARRHVVVVHPETDVTTFLEPILIASMTFQSAISNTPPLPKNGGEQ